MTSNHHYCPTGWSLYHELAMTYMNVETGEEYSEDYFRATFVKEHAACIAKLDEHFKNCAQCSLADVKRPPTPVRFRTARVVAGTTTFVSLLGLYVLCLRHCFSPWV